MTVSIKPVQSSFTFGTADTVSLRSIADDLLTSATFFWQLGKMTAPADGTKINVFTPDPSAIGNCSVNGSAYTSWDGSNAQAMALCAPMIGVTLA